MGVIRVIHVSPLFYVSMTKQSIFEKALATASFSVAAILAFTSMAISSEHDIAAGVLMAIAQFLILTASILHIDYKLHHYGSTTGTQTTKGDGEQ